MAQLPPAPAPAWTSQRRRLELQLASLSDLPFPHLQQLHCNLLRSNLSSHPSVAAQLVAAYSTYGRLASACAAFALSRAHTVPLFNSLIRSFAVAGEPQAALSAFSELRRRRGNVADGFSYSLLLKASRKCGFSAVKMVHCLVMKLGFAMEISVGNALISSYSKARDGGGLLDARKVFDAMPVRDSVSWNSMISALGREGRVGDARMLFDEMPLRDSVTWNAMLDVYVKAGTMDNAVEFFEQMPERSVVSWSTMVTGYCKKGDLEMASSMFSKMPEKNLVSWVIMVSAHAEGGNAEEASSLLDKMEVLGIELDVAAVVSVLAACGKSSLLGLGKRIHSYICGRRNLKKSTTVCNALIGMFAKCGCLDMALDIFEAMSERDLVSWNSLIGALAKNGHERMALNFFDRMKLEGFRPDSMTFLGVLCACSHAGFTNEACEYLAEMKRVYGVTPQIEHYGCTIDMLSRQGLVKEAFDLAKSMPVKPNVVIWSSLLTACRNSNSIVFAEAAARELAIIEPSYLGTYTMLSNIYAAAGKHNAMAKAKIQTKGDGVVKQVGSSWIEVCDSIHQFASGNRRYQGPSDGTVDMLDVLKVGLNGVSYLPDDFA